MFLSAITFKFKVLLSLIFVLTFSFIFISLPPKKPEVEGKANLSLIVPCFERDWLDFNVFLYTLAEQTVQPFETVVVFSGDPEHELPLAPNFRDTLIPSGKPLPPISIKEEKNFEKYNTINRKRRKANYPPVTETAEHVKNLKVYKRDKGLAGENRLFGFFQTSNETDLIGFVDCDDLMHPRRTELLLKSFNQYPDLDFLLHGWHSINFSHWIKGWKEFMEEPAKIKHLHFDYGYDYIRRAIPNYRGREWNISDPETEPNWEKTNRWWFYKGAEKQLKYEYHPGNGWPTMKKKVLEKVAYPTSLPIGQDSLFNYRVLKTPDVNFNYLDVPLIGYMRRK